jgi:hypothetical protein
MQGRGGMGTRKHRISGATFVSRQSKMQRERDANQPKPQKPKNKMYPSIQAALRSK